MSNLVDIRSCDGVKIPTPLDVAGMWGTVSNLLDSYIPVKENEEQGACLEEVPVPDIESTVLYKTIEYCQKYLKHPESEEWKKIFFKNTYGDDSLEKIKTYHKDLADLALAADYLEIPSLLNDVTKVISETIKNKKSEIIRQEWDIPDDLTDEEKEQIIREHRWAFDL